jgi:hypothetical protein
MAPFGEHALRPYQLGRLHAFLGTGADPQAVWTTLQAHIAVASGGLVGASSAVPHQLLAQYLPARESDLAFASLVEQHGLVAGVAVLLVGAVLVARLVASAHEARTSAGSLFAAGLAALVGGELVVSVAGNLGLLPLAGVPCPLLSAGGTAAMVHLAALGIVVGGRRDAENRRLWRVPRWRRRHPRLARTLAAAVAVTLAATGFSAATLQGEGAGLRRTGVEQATRSIRLPAEPRGSPGSSSSIPRRGTPRPVLCKLALAPDRIATVARELGVGERTGIDLPAEDAGDLGTPQTVARHGGTWYPGSTVTLRIGQGTPRPGGEAARRRRGPCAPPSGRRCGGRRRISAANGRDRPRRGDRDHPADAR